MIEAQPGDRHAGVDNPFYEDAAHMLFGDAGSSMDGIVAALRSGAPVGSA